MSQWFKGLPASVQDLIGASVDSKRKEISSFSGYDDLCRKLKKAHEWLPKPYRLKALIPFQKAVTDLEASRFEELQKGRALIWQKDLFMDIAESILQQEPGHAALNEGQSQALAMAWKVVRDLYDGYFEETVTQRIHSPANPALAPLVRWEGLRVHQTWTIARVNVFGPRVPIVALPIEGATRGVIGWCALAHETIGHDLLSSHDGLLAELSSEIRGALLDWGVNPDLWPGYWSARVDEAASDVMGCVNMGPAYGVALIGIMRAWRRLQKAPAKLRCGGSTNSPYPADFLRAYLVAETVRLFQIEPDNDKWADKLSNEANEDLKGKQLVIDDVPVSTDESKRSAAIVARTILRAPLDSLRDSYGNTHALADFEDWTFEDERLTKAMKAQYKKPVPKPPRDAYAAHVVAAAVLEAVEANKPDLANAVPRMITALSKLH